MHQPFSQHPRYMYDFSIFCRELLHRDDMAILPDAILALKNRDCILQEKVLCLGHKLLDYSLSAL